ncbi:MAG TPA: DUF6683 family protein [Pyrinomonadaceae bacterium]|jgi:hypothetical protein
MKKYLNLFAIIFTFTIVLTFTETTRAQYQYNYSSNMWVNSGMNLLFQKRWATARIRAAGKTQLADALEGRTASGRQTVAPSENVLRRVPLTQTSFKANPSPIMPSVLAANFAEGGDAAVRQFVKVSGELLKNYEQMLITNRETRLKNNVAGAATFALMMSRSVLTGKDLTEKQAEAVLQDINSLLASSENFRQLPDDEKQKMYEVFVITSGLAAMLHQQGIEENNAEKSAQGKDLAKTILSQFFDRPLDEIEFTEQGVQFP